MNRACLIAILAMTLLATLPAAAQETFLRTLPGADVDGRPELREGRRLFNLHFLDKPDVPQKGGGLGPLFNRNACSSCHPRGGRGAAPGGPDEPLLTALVRLSLPGKAKNGGPVPHPGYGGQLNTRSVRGVAPEARVAVSYETIPGRYADGTAFELRRPRISIEDLAYGPLHETLTSFRIGQPVYGLGLLEAVSMETIERWADPSDANRDGISGRTNRVWDRWTKQAVLGRFGWKATEPSLEQQTASAFQADMGITNTLFADHDCGRGQTACQKAESPSPEMPTGGALFTAEYLMTIAPPTRRRVEENRHGEELFEETGCTACHRPSFGIVSSERPYLNGLRVDAYTDLLLHDMGDGLADGRPDFEASGREWRTPPLWGLGLAETVHGRFALLHDGRARSIEEAILWHGGEGIAAMENFRAMSSEDREALIAFLMSL